MELVRREVWPRLVDQPASTWQELDRDVLTPLSTLAGLCVGSDCPPLQVDIGSGTETAPWLAVHSSGVRPQLAERRSPALHAAHVGRPRPRSGRRLARPVPRTRPARPPVVAAVATNQVRNLETACSSSSRPSRKASPGGCGRAGNVSPLSRPTVGVSWRWRRFGTPARR